MTLSSCLILVGEQGNQRSGSGERGRTSPSEGQGRREVFGEGGRKALFLLVQPFTAHHLDVGGQHSQGGQSASV